MSFFFLNFVRKLNAKFHNSHTTLHSCQCENVPAASTFSLTCVFKKNIIINILIDVKWCSTVVCFHFLYDLGCLAWFSCTHWPLISISSEKRSFAPLAYFNRVFKKTIISFYSICLLFLFFTVSLRSTCNVLGANPRLGIGCENFL